jgi:uncharacterized protein (TIRG00374 family)
MSDTLKLIVGLSVGLAILGLWLYFVGLDETLDALTAVAPVPAILATLAWILAIGLRAWKWHRLLVPLQRVPFPVSARVYWASSFLNVIFPFRVGELARSLFMKQLVDMPIATSLPTVLVDRLYSIAVILIVLLFLPFTPFGTYTHSGSETVGLLASGLRWGIGIVAAGFFATLVFLYLLRNQKERLLQALNRILGFLPQRVRTRLVEFTGSMIDGMRFVRSDAGYTALLLGLALAVLFADALKDHFVLRAFGLHVPVLRCLMGVCITNLAFILPSPPGSIGSNEWYATLVYAVGFGYSGAQVASAALFGHAMTTVIVAAAGALSLSSLGLSVAEGLRISQGGGDTQSDRYRQA